MFKLYFAALGLIPYLITTSGHHTKQHTSKEIWTWNCVNGNCEKKEITDSATAVALDVCRLTCNKYSVVWPRPTGYFTVSPDTVSINPNSIYIKTEQTGTSDTEQAVNHMIKAAGKIFTDNILKRASRTDSSGLKDSGKNLIVTISLSDPSALAFKEDTDESYTVGVDMSSDGGVNANITATTFFGGRHGLETLSQLIVYDPYSKTLKFPAKVNITDKPIYSYRGLLLDTSRNYISVEAIKRTLDGMAMNKLNTFHWHITDSHSFPFVSRSFPHLAEYGAYSPEKVYTEENISDLVQYGKLRGIRILPEFDAPAHVGEGWQWAGDATVCFNAHPWQKYCVEPPCGQLNPTSEGMYSILEGIYKDMNAIFDSDWFHMGGDEVNFNCWNSSSTLVENMKKMGLNLTDDGFHDLWAKFQSRAHDLLNKVSEKKRKVVIWTSTLTGDGKAAKYLNKDQYIIQIWTKANDPVIAELVNNEFPVIFSNYDALYFDCGFGAWVGSGNNWCSPYIPWQTVYENDPVKILEKLGVNSTQAQKFALGSEVTLWTEQADDFSVDNRLWPRGAAAGEQLWSGGGSWKDAEQRYLIQRDRMTKFVAADTVQPEWCLQNQGDCYL